MEKGHSMRFIIADDHPLVRRGLVGLLLDNFPDAEIVEVGSAREVLDILESGHWDLAMLDINMPGRNGLDLLEDIRRIRPRLPMLVISAHLEEDYALRALKLGAAGYVSKQCASDVLVAAVKKVISGGRHVSPAVAEKLAMAAAGDWVGAPHEALSHRELQVLRMIAAGNSVKEIAAELALSEKTVATYRGRISVKLSLSTNVDLTRYAVRHRLVD